MNPRHAPLSQVFPWCLREVPNHAVARLVQRLVYDAQRAYGNCSSFAVDSNTSDTPTYGRTVHVWMSDATRDVFLQTPRAVERFGEPVRTPVASTQTGE